MPRRFPPGFWWGASTSAHQVEGDNHNDWNEWEHHNAKKLAQNAGDYPGARDPKNYLSGAAADHWHHYAADLDKAKSIGLNAYRFSVEWSRIEPREGEFDQVALEHYRKVIRAAKTRGLEPFVCLWHWTLPLWLSDRGGWRKQSTIRSYMRFTKVVVEALGPEVKYWLTLNEPEVYAENVFQTGRWLAQRRNGFLYVWSLRNLATAHKRAYRIIKNSYPGSWVGMAKHNIYFEPANRQAINKWIVWYSNRFWNHQFITWVKRHIDFVGLNYYFHSRLNLWRSENLNERVSDMGWELYPKGLYHLLMDLSKTYRKPIVITEHGLADAGDQNRAWYIEESLRNVLRAVEHGADVRGYFHWSLLDNFEWDSGFWPRFGLIAVDYKTQKRTIRPSAKHLAKIIKAGQITD